MNLAVVGDSFSSNAETGSWIDLLTRSHTVENYSLRSISQYRIFDILTKNLSDIVNSDAVIIWHTNPDRIYVNDEIEFPTRKLSLHHHADLVAADSLNSQDREWQNTAKTYYKIFYNQQQQMVYYTLILEKIKSILAGKKVIHCSGFNLVDMPEIKSFNYLLSTNPGNINHCDTEGNSKIHAYISSML
jgi:hypothetical protein